MVENNGETQKKFPVIQTKLLKNKKGKLIQNADIFLRC